MTELEMMRKWVQTWKEAGPELEAIRQQEVRDADNVVALAQMERLFDHATDSQPPRESSGLVEMQRLFAKLPR